MNSISFVAYYRVSTVRQGKSGLGLEAQKRAVADFLSAGKTSLIDEFTEVESGRRKDRPMLVAALEECRKRKATLIIAKLDRLARNVAFVSALIESRVKFIAADMPEADVAFLQMAAVFGEWEARKISERTCAALSAAKARGTKLGWAHPKRKHEQRVASQRGGKASRQKAERFAANTIPVVESIRGAGVSTLQGAANALNERGIRTARGGKWYPTTVRNLLVRKSERLPTT